jgi:hypothetical protein
MAKEVNEMGYGVVDQFGFPQGTGPEVSCQLVKYQLLPTVKA